MNPSPTRADVAKLAGVSPAVVSYVVNDGPRPVSDKTRKRVKKAISELGYRPNQVARALRGTRSSSICLLMPDAGNPFFWDFAERIESECLKRGYVLFIGTTGNDPERERNYLSSFADRQVDGLIIISSSPTWQFSEDDFRQLPLVFVDRAPIGGRSQLVQTDSFRGALLAATHLVETHNSRNVLMLAGPSELPITRLRIDGALAAFEPAGAEHTVVNCDFSFEAGYRATKEAIRAGDGTLSYDAIFAFTDAQAIGVLRACAEHNISVPGDLSLVSFDGTELADFVVPSLTTVYQDTAELAKNALDAIERAINMPAVAESTVDTAEYITSNLELRLGASCGCARATS